MTEGEIRAAWMKDVKPRPVPPDTRTKPPWKPFQDPARIWLGLEYFCQEGDGLWTSSDEALIRLAGEELAKLRIAPPKKIIEATPATP